MAFEKVAEVGDIASGEGKTVFVGGRQFALFCIGGAYYGLDNECPHRDGPLGEGEIEGDTVLCPWHAWQVNIRTGAVLHTADFCVASHACKVEDGSVYMDV